MLRNSILFSLMILFHTGNAQLIDTATIKLIAKSYYFLEFIPLQKDISNESLSRFLNENIEVEFLDAKGFTNMSFVKVYPKYSAVEEPNRALIICSSKDPILAVEYGNYRIYRLRGFFQNDFYHFKRYLEQHHYKKMNSPKQLQNNYYVEELDLKCLYRAYKSNSNDTREFPCLQYCAEPINIK